MTWNFINCISNYDNLICNCNIEINSKIDIFFSVLYCLLDKIFYTIVCYWNLIIILLLLIAFFLKIKVIIEKIWGLIVKLVEWILLFLGAIWLWIKSFLTWFGEILNCIWNNIKNWLLKIGKCDTKNSKKKW